MKRNISSVIIVGAGLAGCECALTLARFGISSVVYEQKPVRYSPAHTNADLGELVCSNSFRSDISEGMQSTGVGLLKAEMRALGSAIMSVAEEHKVPAGKALAVNRDLFAQALTARMEAHPLITLIHEPVDSLESLEALINETDNTDMTDSANKPNKADFIDLAKAESLADSTNLDSENTNTTLQALKTSKASQASRIAQASQFSHTPIIITAGPLASDALASSLATRIGLEHCYFYDAIAPIVGAESLDMSIIFRASRYGNLAPPPYNNEIANDAELSRIWREKMQAELLTMKQANEAENAIAETLTINEQVDDKQIDNEQINNTQDDGDYLNCPMNKNEYTMFYEALLEAEKVAAHNFEKEIHFEGCMPIETLASRGDRTLTFGPLKPVGFTDPRTGRRPYAVLQLRAENLEKTSYNLVGCQTKMTYQAQDVVFRLIPGLEQTDFIRFGSMHRNTFINSPKCLGKDLALLTSPHIYIAGQISGVEGYVESASSGLWLALILVSKIYDFELEDLPKTTALGALMAHLCNDINSTNPKKTFQPSNVHFGLMPTMEGKITKKNRKVLMAERAREHFQTWLASMQEHFTAHESK